MKTEKTESILLTENERVQNNLLIEEIKNNGPMSTEELIKRFDAIPFDDFMLQMHNKILSYDNNGDICK